MTHGAIIARRLAESRRSDLGGHRGTKEEVPMHPRRFVGMRAAIFPVAALVVAFVATRVATGSRSEPASTASP
jgi:hypothetical protein